MARPVLVDTDILIDYLRGHAQAARWLEGLKQPARISVLSITELYAGVRDGEERETLDRFLEAFDWVGVDGEIARQAGLYRRDFGKTHGTGLADAVIAACAQAAQATLATLNTRHFPMLDDVVRPYQKR
jgi:predicted nucleic acid-binding protein